MSFERSELDQALDPTGKTKLIAACEDKDVQRVRSLLTSKASVDCANKDGQTPLYAACKAGSAELVQMLLFARASATQANAAGFSPLYIASQKGHLDCCQTLITSKANVDQGAKNRSTPLLCAPKSPARAPLTRIFSRSTVASLFTFTPCCALRGAASPPRWATRAS